jgi:hypothetical protein
VSTPQTDDRWGYLAKLELKDQRRLEQLASMPTLDPHHVAEVDEIASKVGMPVRMERVDLTTCTKQQYTVGTQRPADGQVDVSILLDHEIAMINRILKAHGIRAEARKSMTLVAHSSFISYGLRLAPDEKIAKLEGIHRELANALRAVRVRHGYTANVVVRVRDQPVAIETPHPAPIPLDWRGATLRLPGMHALVGKRYYGGSSAETVALPTNHHMLVAAMSGGGKSTLVRMALSTLCLNTSPDDLAVLLVDLKNDDLVPFKRLPHCIGYAGNLTRAAQAIDQLTQIRDARIEGGDKTQRILLVVDELAELSDDKDALAQLGRILSTGRSLGINVWAGTQYPTASAIGSVVSRSWTLRLVGRVDGANAANIATQRPGTGAQYLAHPGDFLRVDGPDTVRFKAYQMPQSATAGMVQAICDRWGKVAAPSLFDKPAATTRSSAVVVEMSEEDRMVETLRPLFREGASLAAMIRAVFGPNANTGGANRTRVQAALDIVRATTTIDEEEADATQEWEPE